MGRRCSDVIGKRFGKLIVLERTCNDNHHAAQFLCKCDCGNTTIVRAYSLTIGHTTSCGCYKKSCTTTHGKSYSSEWRTWSHIKGRCENIHDRGYPDYGGRGIKLYKPWSDSFEAFYAFMGDKPSQKHSIERIDNNGNYEPGNVKWGTPKEQNNNTRANHVIEHHGQRKTLAQWSEITGIPYFALWARLRYGWSVERAFTEKVGAYYKYTHPLDGKKGRTAHEGNSS
jgi:hypothetical protein